LVEEGDMDDRDRLHAYLMIKDLGSCTAEEVANLTGLPKHEVGGILSELVRENVATESRGSYSINHWQKEAIGQRAADLILHLRGAPRHGS
jgi:DNA-binding IclR family transcriptional regulator